MVGSEVKVYICTKHPTISLFPITSTPRDIQKQTHNQKANSRVACVRACVCVVYFHESIHVHSSSVPSQHHADVPVITRAPTRLTTNVTIAVGATRPPTAPFELLPPPEEDAVLACARRSGQSGATSSWPYTLAIQRTMPFVQPNPACSKPWCV